MGTKFNPDGAKIRTLRIQRGWTQEQLAEIAGISSRTIQRAETANCAAFETVRAIAGAFETDFDQLLKSEARRAPDPEPQMASPAHVPVCDLELEPIVTERPELPARRTWTTFLVAASALAAGLSAGIIFTSRPDKHTGSHPTVPRIISVAAPQVKASHEAPQPDKSVRQAEPVPRTVPTPVSEASIPNRMADVIAENSKHSISAAQTAEILIAANLASQDVIHRSQQPASLDLPLQPLNLLSTLSIPEEPFAWSAFPVLSGKPARDEQDPGAVRQAMDLAAKKTGSFVSRVGTSIKRVF